MNSIQVKNNSVKYNPVNGMDMILTLSNKGGVLEDGTLSVVSKEYLSNEVRYLLCVSIDGNLYELSIGFDHYTSASISWEPSTESTDSFFASDFINQYGPIPVPTMVPNVTQAYYNSIYNGIMQQIGTSTYNPNNVAATNFRSIKSKQVMLNQCIVKQTNDLGLLYFTAYYPGNSNSNFDETPNILFVLRYSTDYPYTLNFVEYNYVDVKGENNQSLKTLNLTTNQSILRTNDVVYGWNAIGLTLTPGRNTNGKNNSSILYNVIDQVITGSKNTTAGGELFGEENVYNFNYIRGLWDNYEIRLNGLRNGDAFGVSIAGSRDNGVMVVGANNEIQLSMDFYEEYGYVQIFRKALPPTSSIAPIVLEQTILDPNYIPRELPSCFGGSVCMSGDGKVLVVGTKLTSSSYYNEPILENRFYNNQEQFFNVYLYNPDAEEGSRWEFKVRYDCPYGLTDPSNPYYTPYGLNFPASISMNYDGTKIVASGYRVLNPYTELFRTKEDQFALVFEYDGATSIQEVQKLTTPVQPDDDGPWQIQLPPLNDDVYGQSYRANFLNYGACCKLSEDGQYLLVSEIAGNLPSFYQGAKPNVYIYLLNGSEYQLDSKIKAGTPGTFAGDPPYYENNYFSNYYTYPDGPPEYKYRHGNYFGYQLDISSDNNSIFIGDPSVSMRLAVGTEINDITDVGALMIYDFVIPPEGTSGVWTKVYEALGDSGGDQFGLTMAKAYQQNYIAVASPGGNQGTGYFRVFKKFD